jgi:hypothetical protein
MLIFGQNDPLHFGNLSRSLLSCFQTATLDNWSGILYTNLYGCGTYPISGISPVFFSENCQNTPPKFIISSLFFAMHIPLSGLVILSLFIGQMIAAMYIAHNQHLYEIEMKNKVDIIVRERRIPLSHINRYKEVFRAVDIMKRGFIGHEELQFGLKLAGINLSLDEYNTFYSKLDCDFSSNIEFGEFIIFLIESRKYLKQLSLTHGRKSIVFKKRNSTVTSNSAQVLPISDLDFAESKGMTMVQSSSGDESLKRSIFVDNESYNDSKLSIDLNRSNAEESSSSKYLSSPTMEIEDF